MAQKGQRRELNFPYHRHVPKQFYIQAGRETEPNLVEKNGYLRSGLHRAPSDVLLNMTVQEMSRV